MNARRWLEGVQTSLGASAVQLLEYTHQAAGRTTGVFTESITVTSEHITVRGAVVDGVARVGSLWVP